MSHWNYDKKVRESEACDKNPQLNVNGSVNDISAQKRNFFNFNNNNNEYLNIGNVIEVKNAIEKVKEMSKSIKQMAPQPFGLSSSPSKVKAEATENESAQASITESEETASSNNQAAEENIETTEQTAEADNKTAEDNIETSESTAEENNKAAEEATNEAKKNASSNNDEAQKQVDNANNELQKATSAVSAAQSALDTARANLQQAQNSGEENKNSDAVKQAQDAVTVAEKKLTEAKEAEAKAKEAVEKAKQNQEQVKSEGEKAVQESEENTQSVKAEGEKAVQAAKDSATEVKAKGEEAVKKSEQNAVTVETKNDAKIKEAKTKADKVKKQGDVDMQAADAKAKEVQKDVDKLSEAGRGIYATLANSDPYNSLNRFEIDTKAEWKRLGAFLDPEENNNANGYEAKEFHYTAKDITDSDRKILQNIYEGMKDKYESENDISVVNDTLYKMIDKENYNKKDYNKAIQNINSDNIGYLNTDSIDRIYNNDFRNDKTKAEDCETVKSAILKKANELGIQDESAIADFANDPNNSKFAKCALIAIQTESSKQAFAGEVDKIKAKLSNENYPWESDLQKSAQEYFVKAYEDGTLFDADGRLQTYDYLKGYGGADGNIGDNLGSKSTQETGNCWLMAGINSLGDDSDLISQNIYRDALYGITAVKLPEAEKYANQDYVTSENVSPNGIYCMSDAELKTNAARLASGDKDIVAYNYAIEKYFKEKAIYGENIDVDKLSASEILDYYSEGGGSIDGATPARLYEIATGETKTSFNDCNIPDGVGMRIYGRQKATKEDYDALVEHVRNGGKVILGFNYDINVKGTTRNISHAFSVVGVDSDGKLVVQESNNSRKISETVVSEENIESDKYGNYYMHLDPESFCNKVFAVGTYKKRKNV